MSADIETRRRRLLYRAEHRGTKEMDWLVGRFVAGHLASFDEAGIERFERFLNEPEPLLQAWLLNGSGPADGEFADLVEAIRRFHGLSGAA